MRTQTLTLRKAGIFVLGLACTLSVCFLALTAAHAHAQDASALPSGGLVPCGQDGPLDAAGRQACGFEQVMILIGRLIRFLIFYVAPIIVVVTLLWGGFLILTSGGSAEQVTKAKGMFWKAIVGLVIAMAAWLIVRFVLVQLGVDENVFPVFY